MEDDFDNDNEMDLSDNLDDDALGDLGDLGGDVAGEIEPFGGSSEAAGTRSSGGARANAKLSAPEPAAVRAPRPPAPKAKKAATPAKKRAPVKAAKKKTAGKKAAKKKAGGKKKARPGKRRAGSK